MSKLLGLLVVLALWPMPASARERPCGVDAACVTASGDYQLLFPPGWDGVTPLPAVVFFHGHSSSSASVIMSAGLKTAFVDHGYLLIAPNGAVRPGGDVRGWAARPAAAGERDDVAFLREVMTDVEARAPLDQGRVLVSGFSSGGSMAWLVACYDGARYSAFAPVSGALREPHPEGACPSGPVRLFHFHGWTDNQVPLEGRTIRDWHQGDVFASLDLLRHTNQCESKPTSLVVEGIYRCRSWDACGSGRDIHICLHDGGHMMPEGWADMARVWFENGKGGA